MIWFNQSRTQTWNVMRVDLLNYFQSVSNLSFCTYRVSQKKSTFLKFRVDKSMWQFRPNQRNKIVWNGPTVHNCPNYPNCPIQSLTRVISGQEKVILICRPQISERYFFLGHPVCKKGWEDLENGEVVGLNWGVAGHLKIMIITI